MLVSGCTSTTMIHSKPEGAKLYLNDEYVGTTPFAHSDQNIVFTCTHVKLEQEGYEPFYSNFCRNEEAEVGAIVAGIFVWIPLLWAMKYKPSRTYELVPAGSISPTEGRETSPGVPTSSKADRLRDLKALFDEGILTQEEYEREKKKILEED
jgi:hypothetical protein